jgi:hypothetical protein
MEISHFLRRKFDSVIPLEPGSNNYQIYSGFDLNNLKWVIIGVGLSEKLLKNSNEIGFPKIIEKIEFEQPIFVFEDSARFDELIVGDKTNLPIQIGIIELFVESLERILMITDNISLQQNSVFLSEGNFQFLGVDLEDKDSPSIISWICTIITKDLAFLYNRDFKKVCQIWEGIIPLPWQDISIIKKTSKNQLQEVKKWFLALDDNNNFLTKSINDRYLISISEISSDWGQRAVAISLTLNLDEFTKDQKIKLLREISRFPKSIIDWIKANSLILPDIEWIDNIISPNIYLKDDFNKLIPTVIYSSILSKKQFSINTIFESLNNKIPFSGKESHWLLHPNFKNLLTLDLTERKHFFFLAILSRIFSHETGSIVSHFVIILREFIEDLQINLYDEYLWTFINLTDLSDESNLNTDEIGNYFQDLYLVLKNRIEFLNYNVIETLADFLLKNINIFRMKNIFHSIGGMYEVLSHAKKLISSEGYYPNLELVEIFVKRQTLTSNIEWKNLLDVWLNKHSKSKYFEVVKKMKSNL